MQDTLHTAAVGTPSKNSPPPDLGASSTSTDIVRSYFSAFGQGDLEGALALMTDDVMWHVDGTCDVSTVGLIKGKPGVRAWLQRFPESFKPRLFEVDRLFEQDDQVIATGRFRHTVLSTGKTVGSDFVIRFTLRNQKIAGYQIFEDSALLSRAFNVSDDWTHHHTRINGNVYAYSDHGEGPTIVFAHGLFVDRTIFKAQVEALQKSHRCIVLDMPGHGSSGYRRQGWTLDDIADDLALLIDRQSLGPVTFVGQSQGGMVGIRLAAKRPDLVAQLVLIGTSAREEYADRLDTWHQRRAVIATGTERERENMFADIQIKLNHPHWHTHHPDEVVNERATMMAHERNGLALALDAATINRQDIRQLLPDVAAPTLVVCGEADTATPPALSREIASGIALAQMSVLPGVGHHPPIEAPEAVTDLIMTFIRAASRSS